MTGTLNMGRNGISQLKEPSAGSDAATMGYVTRNFVKYSGATANINMLSRVDSATKWSYHILTCQ
jgi:hypothetical protein